ncbi:DUF1203 domain-containing protein [Actinoplanes sp. NPDC051494]|uniref:DUF1203 domain-containing protein n=1 Tax=Actinoplanes sp. NPDC051494 TaxID=3363907 RepID=UPI0037A7ACB4
MTPTATILSLPGIVLDRVRSERRDVSGNPVEFSEAEGGEPLRCCLRNAEAGEGIMLFGFEPDLPASPYREIGAVFAHAEPCATTIIPSRYPDDWRDRPQVLRAYDSAGRIHPASRVHDGSDPEGVIAAIFADPEVVQIHSRNIVYGCYMFTVQRG